MDRGEKGREEKMKIFYIFCYTALGCVAGGLVLILFVSLVDRETKNKMRDFFKKNTTPKK